MRPAVGRLCLVFRPPDGLVYPLVRRDQTLRKPAAGNGGQPGGLLETSAPTGHTLNKPRLQAISPRAVVSLSWPLHFGKLQYVASDPVTHLRAVIA